MSNREFQALMTGIMCTASVAFLIVAVYITSSLWVAYAINFAICGLTGLYMATNWGKS